jgi:hypothetical protein
VPILPRLGASHGHFSHANDMKSLRFGEIFDLPRLSKALGMPILEWDNVKNFTSDTFDEIGCWSIWYTVTGKLHGLRGLDDIKLGRLGSPTVLHGLLFDFFF